MNKLSKKEKINQAFDDFFEGNKTIWRPSDFKNYNRSIYNILCDSYKNGEDKIDWNYILDNFVSEENREKFKRTNIYDEQGIKKQFSDFFESQKNKGLFTWTVGELDNYNNSLLITIARKYGYKGEGFVARESFVKDYGLDSLGFKFVRYSPVHTKITVERIAEELSNKIKENSLFKRSPYKLRPQYLKWFGKNYRNTEGKIDRLYILYKLLGDEKIVDKFRHRYGFSRLLYVPAKTKENIPLDNKIDINSLNPEEIMIQNEEEESKQSLLNKVYDIIEGILSEEEKRDLFNRLDSDNTSILNVKEIISKIKERDLLEIN